MTHLRHVGDPAVQSPGVLPRKRLPRELLEKLLTRSARALQPVNPTSEPLWCGHRFYAVDGSSASSPRIRPTRKGSSASRPGARRCGFPVPKLLGLFDAFSGLVCSSMLCFPLYTHERSKVRDAAPAAQGRRPAAGRPRVLLAFVHLAMLFSRGVCGLFRMHQKQIVDFRPAPQAPPQVFRGQEIKGAAKEKWLPRSWSVRRLGKHDQVVRGGSRTRSAGPSG